MERAIRGIGMVFRADKILGLGINKTAGGSTRCREKGCGCVISNDEYYTYESTNKVCGCGHYYYNHDVFN